MLISMIRTVILYAGIILALRLMGKRQINQLQTSELVVTLLLSELAVLPIQNREETLVEGLAPMVTLVLFELLIAFLMLKSSFLRLLVCGRPVVIIKDGKLNQKAMRKLRMTTEDLTEQLRQKNVFFYKDVQYAVIETNGMMSVVKYAKEDNLTPKQAGVKVENRGIEAVVLSDGVLSKSSMELVGTTKEWVLARVEEQHLDVKDIFIMTVDTMGQFKIIEQELRPKRS